MSPGDAKHPWATTASTGIIRITLSAISSGTNIPPPPEPTAEELRLRQLYAWTREAIQEARETLRTTDDDPSGVLPHRPRSEPSVSLHEVPRFRRRICAGSSRYRVMYP